MQIDFPAVYDDAITEEADGTFTISLAPWFMEPIRNVPTKQLAREFLHAAHEAMDEAVRNALMD